MINKSYNVSLRRQSELLNINRSSLYFVQNSASRDHGVCNLIAEIYSNYPIYGYRRITAILRRQGVCINKKRVQRLMREMNLRAIYPGPNTSKRLRSDFVYPYLLGDLEITKPNEVWQTDITYLRTHSGFMYLVAIIDVYSRVVVSYKLSNSLGVSSCINALGDAIHSHGKPEIINSDQGSQYTSNEWTAALKEYKIKISMTGKGRCNDNANIERLWRSLKYEGSYFYKWNSVSDLKINISKWIEWYNYRRPHQALDYATPSEVYYGFMDKSVDLPTIPQYQQLQDLFL